LNKKLLAMLVALVVSGNALAVDEAATADCDELEEARTSKIAQDLPQWIPPNPNDYFGSGSCLDSILNRKISVIFSMPDLNSIMGGLMDAATNQACNVANQAVSKAMGSASQNLNMPIRLPTGQVLNPGVSTGTIYSAAGTGALVSGGGSTYSTPTYTPTKTAPSAGASQTEATNSNSLLSRFKNIFR
jgi:hypothetical protein